MPVTWNFKDIYRGWLTLDTLQHLDKYCRVQWRLALKILLTCTYIYSQEKIDSCLCINNHDLYLFNHISNSPLMIYVYEVFQMMHIVKFKNYSTRENKRKALYFI